MGEDLKDGMDGIGHERLYHDGKMRNCQRKKYSISGYGKPRSIVAF
jgi:hypothetical protein